ncbi:M4 family metallopeptidase [Chengkuizengella sediminis]|uniref:M4 family metallopeptidase n=1 Tax=Chengkuizengella sediminis TaxID=1885917 RepID=UPI001389642E|nr:M4 family metallopeptidase [Chengkuizengella sediminis]NDI36098.1 peptidase M4 family protein [Chengkuizengella sediminis]
MKKINIMSILLATMLTFGVLFTSIIDNVSANSPIPETASKEVNDKQMKKLDKMKEKSLKEKGEFNVSWNEKKGIPRYISGKLSDENTDISSFLEENKDLFNIVDGDFEILTSDSDELGMTHYKTQFTVDGIPVYGAELTVHTDNSGVITSLNGQVEPSLVNKKWSKSIKLSSSDSIEVAENQLSFTPKEDTYTTEPTADLYMYQHEGKWMPVYIVELQFLEPYIGREFSFIDAKKGEVLKSYNRIQDSAEIGTGTGLSGETRTINTYLYNGTYYLYDVTRDGIIRTYDANDRYQTGSLVTDSNNNFNSTRQKAAVDAHYYGGVVYDYFLNKHNRNSFDNRGSDFISSVHVGDPEGGSYINASWVGTQWIYGDGGITSSGTEYTPFSESLDVVAHEVTHAVTDYSANLVYEFQPGALNESFSDVFGILVEADYEGTPDWLLGEDIYTPDIEGDAMRYMYDPTLNGRQPAHMDDYVSLPNTREGDWGGVHINSGIPNKAFYNIATDIGLEKSGKIYYRALTRYLNSQSQFIDARNALLQAAADLHGTNSAEYNAVANGYASVGIGN